MERMMTTLELYNKSLIGLVDNEVKAKLKKKYE